MTKQLVQKGLTRVTKLEFDLLSHEEGWWEGKLDEVRESGMIGLEGGRWTNAGAIGWIRGNDERSAEYDLALQDYAHKVAMECLPIADGEGDVQRDRLRTDVRMKLASKWDRSRYGEKVDVVHGLTGGFSAALQAISERRRLVVEVPVIADAVVIEDAVVVL